MIYLSGTLHKDLYGVCGVGMMLSPRSIKPVPAGMPVAYDNCAFGGNYPGDDALLRFLDSRSRDGVLFAVAPDVVGDAAATWNRSREMLPRIRALGFPVAYAGQDGFDPDAIAWDAFDVLFIGGSTEWKMGDGGRRAIAAGLERNKAIHFGRCNSLVRLMYAAGLGCASADGTTIRFNPGRYVPELRRWLSAVNAPRLLVA